MGLTPFLLTWLTTLTSKVRDASLHAGMVMNIRKVLSVPACGGITGSYLFEI